MDKVEFAEIMRNRTKDLALRMIRLFQFLPKTDEARIIGKQLLRSTTSVAANYRAACRARSDAEYYSKICIVVEEADETLLWLEILSDAKIVAPAKLSALVKEITEILSIFSKAKSNLKPKSKIPK
jgi:four helix bundle protein